MQIALEKNYKIVFVNGPMYPFPVEDEAHVLILHSQCSLFILL